MVPELLTEAPPDGPTDGLKLPETELEPAGRFDDTLPPANELDPGREEDTLLGKMTVADIPPLV
jgi:hypothetical protein